MSIAILIPDRWEPESLVHWSTTIARAKGEDLLIIRARRFATKERKRPPLDVHKDATPLAEALRKHAGDFTIVDLAGQKQQKPAAKKKRRRTDDSEQLIYIKQIKYTDLVENVLQQIKALRVKLLILPRQRGVRISEEEFAIERQLFLEVPCETMQLRPGKRVNEAPDSILVATSGGKRAFPALNLGAEFAASKEKKLTALYVKKDDQTPPRKIGRRKSEERLVSESLKAYDEFCEADTVVDEDVTRGVNSYAKAKGHDVVIVGAGSHLAEDRQLPISVPEKLMAEMDDPTVVVIRNKMPLTGRMLRSIEHRKNSLVPQLDREGRIALVERLESSSHWDFDFVFLICLATLLASLGLALDSPPVVIGAMLVAPLMTPMLGLGLSVVQGNKRMAHSCLATIARGFAAAFLTGCLVGILRILFTSGLTDQMSSRGSPGVLDLVVAFVSGMVAAYAFGRPHLLSVLPGIAIATSLVPPVATAGLSMLTLELNVALGATLLFLSNFIAIVLGSASSLWFVGMRGPREVCPFSAWAQRWMCGLFAVAACLAMFFTAKREFERLEAPAVAEVEDSSSAPLADDSNDNAETAPRENAASGEATASASSATIDKAPSSNLPDSQADEKQQAGELRIVLKPPLEPGDGADLTVVLPEDPQAQEGKPQSGRGRFLQRWLKGRNNFSLRILREKREEE